MPRRLDSSGVLPVGAPVSWQHHHQHHNNSPRNTTSKTFDLDERSSSERDEEHDIVSPIHFDQHYSLRTPPHVNSRKLQLQHHYPQLSPSPSDVDIVSLPESVVVSGGGSRQRRRIAHRSFSHPLPALPTMSSTSSTTAATTTANRHVSLESVPSSPPELSYSKSSKSSSSDEDDLSDSALTEKSTHFEEVGLEGDSAEDCNQPPDSRPTLKRPVPRSIQTTGDIHNLKEMGSESHNSKNKSPPLPNGMRQKYPSLHGAVSGALRDQSLNLPSGRRSMQRAASSPTSPFMRQHPQRVPSRSPSPNKPYSQRSFSSSSQTLTSNTSDTPKENGQITRRPSWQPGRKTAQELEAEYNDDDEDVPEEAILENVPISPMPGHYIRSPSMTSLRSTTPSPHRRSPHANLHSANIPKQAKRPHARNSNGPPLPRSPKHARPPMPHSATIASFPAEPFSRKHRSKSWTEDLNEEAKQLSQALEEYAERVGTEKRVSLTNTPSSSPPRPGMPKQRAKSSAYEVSTVQLSVPPVQKGNIMIDPLPISKEKEAVLSRTRPSWLPPKDPVEEKKHLKEFQQMMAKAAEAEKKRALKEQENREEKEEMKGSLAKIWEQHVLPNWDTVVKEPRTRELWWRGVTPRNRGEVWQKAIGNELELSAASFEAALKRAEQLEEKFADLPDEESAKQKESAWFTSIARDVPHTFPELGMYQTGGRLHQSLTDVLKAFAMYRHDVGYVYGTHLIAGIVCLLLPAPEAFVLLANMLNRPLPLAFLVHDQHGMCRAYNLTLQTLKYKFTRLHDHLTSDSLGLRAEDYLDPLFRCLFAYNLPPETVMRLWDVFVFEGDRALIRAAVGVLGILEPRMYGSKEEILGLVGWRCEERWEVGGEEEVLRAVREAGKVDVESGKGGK